MDVNDDGYLSPLDALNAVNRINEGEGQDDIMKYVLKTFNADGTQEISQINVGGTFQLRVFVDDLRTIEEVPDYPPDHPTKPNQSRRRRGHGLFGRAIRSHEGGNSAGCPSRSFA